MSARKRGGSVKPVGAGDPGGFDNYSFAGSGEDLDYNVSMDDPGAVAYIQIWYQEDSIAAHVLVTVAGLAALGTVHCGPRAANAFASARTLNSRGDVLQIGPPVDITD